MSESRPKKIRPKKIHAQSDFEEVKVLGSGSQGFVTLYKYRGSDKEINKFLKNSNKYFIIKTSNQISFSKINEYIKPEDRANLEKNIRAEIEKNIRAESIRKIPDWQISQLKNHAITQRQIEANKYSESMDRKERKIIRDLSKQKTDAFPRGKLINIGDKKILINEFISYNPDKQDYIPDEKNRQSSPPPSSDLESFINSYAKNNNFTYPKGSEPPLQVDSIKLVLANIVSEMERVLFELHNVEVEKKRVNKKPLKKHLCSFDFALRNLLIAPEFKLKLTDFGASDYVSEKNSFISKRPVGSHRLFPNITRDQQSFFHKREGDFFKQTLSVNTDIFALHASMIHLYGGLLGKQINEVLTLDRYDLALMSTFNPDNAEYGKVYLSTTGEYYVRGPNGIEKGSINLEEVLNNLNLSPDMDNLEELLNQKEFQSAVLKRTLEKGHTLDKITARMTRNQLSNEFVLNTYLANLKSFAQDCKKEAEHKEMPENDLRVDIVESFIESYRNYLVTIPAYEEAFTAAVNNDHQAFQQQYNDFVMQLDNANYNPNVLLKPIISQIPAPQGPPVEIFSEEQKSTESKSSDYEIPYVDIKGPVSPELESLGYDNATDKEVEVGSNENEESNLRKLDMSGYDNDNVTSEYEEKTTESNENKEPSSPELDNSGYDNDYPEYEEELEKSPALRLSSIKKDIEDPFNKAIESDKPTAITRKFIKENNAEEMGAPEQEKQISNKKSRPKPLPRLPHGLSNWEMEELKRKMHSEGKFRLSFFHDPSNSNTPNANENTDANPKKNK